MKLIQLPTPMRLYGLGISHSVYRTHVNSGDILGIEIGEDTPNLYRVVLRLRDGSYPIADPLPWANALAEANKFSELINETS